MKNCLRIFILFFLVFSFLVFAPNAFGYGEAGVAPVCTAFAPPAPWLYYAESVGNNQVKLVWDQNPLADSWTVAYGVSAGTYIYGLDRFGDSSTRSITVNDLPGGNYYFVVRANNGCMPGPFSNEQSVLVGGGRAYIPVTYQPVVPGVSPIVTPRVPGYRPPTPTPRQGVPGEEVPTVRPTTPERGMPPVGVPAPEERPGFFQRIINFFLGMFGLGG